MKTPEEIEEMANDFAIKIQTKDGTISRLNAIEWFKAGYTQCQQDNAETAINFAEWLSTNEWTKRTATHPKNVGKYWSNIYCEYKTIKELYEQFLTTLNKQ